jgi:hypothetical protein
MEAVKDSFYVALRDRLANAQAGDAAAVSLFVCENARYAWLAYPDTLYLRWTGEAKLPVGAQCAGWRTLQCEIGYRTQGSELNSNEDRGRRLTALDEQLLAIISPRKAPLLDCKQDPPLPLDGVLFWTAPELEDAQEKLNGIQRTTKLSVLWREEAQA